MKYEIPGQEKFEINTIILDLNGTLSVGGQVPDGVKDRLDTLKERGFNPVFFIGNTRSDADGLAETLGSDFKEVEWRLKKPVNCP